MNISMSLTQQAGYLSIKVQGDYTYSGALGVADGVLAESLKNGRQNVLLDIRGISGSMPDLDRFRLGEYVAGCWKQPLKVAIVARPEAINKFFETVAVNRFVQTRVVPEVHTALEWLLGASPDKLDTTVASAR